MRNSPSKLTLMAAISLALAFTFGCSSDESSGGDSDTGGLNGTWVSDQYQYHQELTLNSGNYEESFNNIPYGKGIYSVNGEKITMKRYHVWGKCVYFSNNEGLDARWYTQVELGSNYDGYFLEQTATYSIGSNILTITWDGHTPNVLTRK